MSKSSEVAQRRHVREKGVIDHLADKVFEPTHTIHEAKTAEGLPVEDQVRKEWNPREGGLPIFSR